jgi:integrase
LRVASPLLQKETFSQPLVIRFLDSVGRNSVKTRRIYGIGLSHLQTYLHQSTAHSSHTLESMVDSFTKNKTDVYMLLDDFVSYLLSANRPTPTKLSPNSINLYVAAVRSFLQYNDIEISPSKFKRKVHLPKTRREDEEPLDAADIRRILLSCSNRRLKSYLLVLASGGMRAVEALAIRNCDCDFSASPTKIHIRKEFSKTRVARDVYISEEATKFLIEWNNFKYRIKRINRKEQTPRQEQAPEDLVFTRVYFNKSKDPFGLYLKIRQEFHSLLRTVEMDQYKEGINRHKITLHSFRRFVKSVISTQTGQDYSEWFLGHAKSPYWTLKESERREIYATKIMKSLTFLDYHTLVDTSKGIVSRLEMKDKEVAYLRDRDLKREQEIKEVRATLDKVLAIVQANPKLANVKKEVLTKI